MLAELRCDQFVDAGLPREPIVFSTGLNIILGSKSASNSIGKTTALLAIDYAFGGNAYTRSDGDVIEHVGPHKIKFAFRFSDVTFRFSRSTDLPDLVFPCDENYSPADPWCMSKYREWLLSQRHRHNVWVLYGLPGSGTSSPEHLSMTMAKRLSRLRKP